MEDHHAATPETLSPQIRPGTPANVSGRDMVGHCLGIVTDIQSGDVYFLTSLPYRSPSPISDYHYYWVVMQFMIVTFV